MGTAFLDRLVSEFAAKHHGHFRIADLATIGVSAGERRLRLERGQWCETYAGVSRIAGAPRTWKGELLAACWALWSHEDASECFGVPVTAVERTLFDLAGLVSPTTLDLAVDRALCLDLTDLGKLGRTLSRLARRGRSGSQRFRAVIEERSPEAALSESERERLLFRMLLRHGFPLPVAQYEICDETGNFVARPDFASPDLKIAIEYESFQEHTGKVALIHDSVRRNAVVALGWAPIAATAVDLRRGGNQLADALRRARNRRITERAS